jgi:DNA topoisomerase VI B subunit
VGQTTLTPGKKERTIAEALAEKQQAISISEFFTKNRHLLGFDNPRKALLTAVKEAVDNSVDACEEMKVLPEIKVFVEETGTDRYKVTVEDNGPGIVKAQIPNIFAKLLYGSKFHRLKQSLTADEPILIQKEGKIEIIPIGDFVDSYLKKEGTKEISYENIFVPAFNPEDNKYYLKKVSHVIKHKRENEILKIRTEYNKEVKVTGCHSLFAFNNGKIESIEARKLKEGSFIVVPRKLPEIADLKEINILDYININDIKDNWMYVYGINEEILKEIKDNSNIIHKKTDKSRIYYRYKGVDILDDSFKQYETKKFLPLNLVFKFGLKDKITNCYIKTYCHGKETNFPVIMQINKQFIRFLGLFVAEGHSDVRQLGLTFAKHETDLVNEIVNYSHIIGLNCTIENRDSTIRVRLFGNMFVNLIRNICGKGATNKIIPEFIFRTTKEMRWHFIDAYCQGDGHRMKKRNALMFATKSKKLALSLQYLFLMNGIASTYNKSFEKGLGKEATWTHKVAIHGNSLNESYIYSRNNSRAKRRTIECNNGKVLGVLEESYELGDLAFVKIKSIEEINEGYDYVYDISVPDCENFVGGVGGITCHNSRGQQGIGISAAALYGQLTTGKPIKIISKIGPNAQAHYYELHLNTKTNEPEILMNEEREWNGKDHGTKVQIELEGKYFEGKSSIEEFLQLTAISNPHAQIIFKAPTGQVMEYPRASNELPKEPREIKPHPYGIELGILIKMLHDTKGHTLSSFLQEDFSRVSPAVAKDICEKARLETNVKPKSITREEADKIFQAIKATKIMAPPTDCLSPIHEERLLKGLKKEINAEFYTAITRPPFVYRGNPFQIEVALAFGGDLPKEELARVIRFANKVPLQHQAGACALTKSVIQTAWKNYGVSQSKGTLPAGPIVIMVHIASVWVPFTSESKEAVASYPEIMKEVRLAVQEVGRKLSLYVRKTVRAREQQDRVDLFEKYIPELASALAELTGEKKSEIQEHLEKTLKKGMKDLMADIEKNRDIEIDDKNVIIGEKQEELSNE